MVDDVGAWLLAAGRVPLLTAEQELLYGRQVRAWMDWPGGPDAAPANVQRIGRRGRDRMVAANLRLVATVAKRCMGPEAPGWGLLDAMQEGAMGLQRGAEKFDPARGYKFSTYAYWWIRQAITRARDEQCRVIRLPIHVHESLSKMRRARSELTQQLGRAPSVEELSVAMGMTEDKVRQLVMQGREAGSLDAPAVGGDDPSALVDLVAAPEAEMAGDACQLVEDVQAAVDRLPPEDAELLRQRMAGRPLWKIGEQRGVSRERVRQLETRARQRLAAVPGLRELLAG